jgi:hypothetical protein
LLTILGLAIVRLLKKGFKALVPWLAYFFGALRISVTRISAIISGDSSSSANFVPKLCLEAL